MEYVPHIHQQKGIHHTTRKFPIPTLLPAHIKRSRIVTGDAIHSKWMYSTGMSRQIINLDEVHLWIPTMNPLPPFDRSSGMSLERRLYTWGRCSVALAATRGHRACSEKPASHAAQPSHWQQCQPGSIDRRGEEHPPPPPALLKNTCQSWGNESTTAAVPRVRPH